MKKRRNSKTSEIIVRNKKGLLLERPAKCDECHNVKPHVPQFPRSNRNYTVNLCDRCLPKVIGRSFPAAKGKRGHPKEHFEMEYFDRYGIETSPFDAMNRVVSGGAFESNPRRH